MGFKRRPKFARLLSFALFVAQCSILPAAQRNQTMADEVANDSWERHFAELKSFEAQHGHCLVVRNNTNKLSLWVDRQRKARRSEKLSVKKIRRLEALGFVWSVTQRRWESSFNAALLFQQKHGHCRIPLTFSMESVRVGSWLNTQRKHARRALLDGALGARLESLYGPLQQEQPRWNATLQRSAGTQLPARLRSLSDPSFVNATSAPPSAVSAAPGSSCTMGDGGECSGGGAAAASRGGAAQSQQLPSRAPSPSQARCSGAATPRAPVRAERARPSPPAPWLASSTASLLVTALLPPLPHADSLPPEDQAFASFRDTTSPALPSHPHVAKPSPSLPLPFAVECAFAGKRLPLPMELPSFCPSSLPPSKRAALDRAKPSLPSSPSVPAWASSPYASPTISPNVITSPRVHRPDLPPSA